MTKKVSKKIAPKPSSPTNELGTVYKITSYVLVLTDENLGSVDVDFFVDSDHVEFIALRQTVESKLVTDEF